MSDESPTIRIQAPKLYPKQAAFVEDPARYTLVEASTKSGKTAACLWWLAKKAIEGRMGQNFWWVAPYNGQAQVAFDRFIRQFPASLITASKTLKTVTLRNGARVSFKSAEKPDTLYGDDVYACVIDEASRVRQEGFHAIRSTLTATRGPVKIIGNVKGRKNWFYQLARVAHDEPPTADPNARTYGYHKLTAYDAVEAGVLAEEEIEDAKQILPAHVFKELYMADAAEDTTNPFGDIHSVVVDGLSQDVPVVWGWDLAEYQDYTCGVALDGEGRVCRFFRWRRAGYDFTIDQIKQHTQNTPAAVDATHGSVGDPIIEFLQQGSDQFEGVEFTKRTKQMLMEGLAVAIQRKEIRIPNDSVLLNELENFEYVPTRSGIRYSAPEGMHDDTVCALALAVYKWQKRQRFQRGPVAIFAGQEVDVEGEFAGLFSNN